MTMYLNYAEDQTENILLQVEQFNTMNDSSNSFYIEFVIKQFCNYNISGVIINERRKSLFSI